MPPQYNRMVVGDPGIEMQIVCEDGQVRMVRTEIYDDGYHAFLIKEDEHHTKHTYTNHVGYPTNRKAINAAAKW